MHLSLLSLSKARSPIGLLKLMTFAMPFSFGVWMALFNNFAIEQGGLNGAYIGVLQSWREVPGFLAFGAVFLLVVIAEQRLAIWSLIMLGVGTALTGWLPSFSGLLVTTMLMSVGFHYYETMKQSLALQWFSKEEAPVQLGRLISIGAASSLLAYGWVWAALEVFRLPVAWVYAFGGGVTVVIALIALVMFPQYESKVPQTKKIVLRKRYSLYYALVFMGGGRRQIFVVFAALMMVERFGFGADEVALMFLMNGLLSMWLAPKIGGLVGRWGVLGLQYCGVGTAGSGFVSVRPRAICHGHCTENLFSKNRRPSRYGFYGRSFVYYQPHRSCGVTCTNGALVVSIALMGIYIGRYYGYYLANVSSLGTL